MHVFHILSLCCTYIDYPLFFLQHIDNLLIVFISWRMVFSCVFPLILCLYRHFENRTYFLLGITCVSFVYLLRKSCYVKKTFMEVPIDSINTDHLSFYLYFQHDRFKRYTCSVFSFMYEKKYYKVKETKPFSELQGVQLVFTVRQKRQKRQWDNATNRFQSCRECN